MAQNEEKTKLLLIDDNIEFIEQLRDGLSEHFSVLVCGDAEKGIVLAKIEQPDLIIVDMKMPKMDGLSVCRALRADVTTEKIPIIMLTAFGDDEGLQVSAFGVGAEDILTKPTRIGPLIARINAKIAKRQPKNETLIEGNITLNPGTREVIIGGEKIEFTTLEFNLLHFLMKHSGTVLSRDQILNIVWKNIAVTKRTVDTHVNYLRKKLRTATMGIESIYGAGYVLRPVESAEQNSDEAQAA